MFFVLGAQGSPGPPGPPALPNTALVTNSVLTDVSRTGKLYINTLKWVLMVTGCNLPFVVSRERYALCKNLPRCSFQGHSFPALTTEALQHFPHNAGQYPPMVFLNFSMYAK